MDIFTKYKFLLRLIIALVILNLFSVGYLWISKKPGKSPEQPARDMQKISSTLRERLKLTRDQADEFERVRKDFFKKEEDLVRSIKSLRDSMNIALFSENSYTAMLLNSARRVAMMEYGMEKLRIEQASSLKAICTPEQLKEFQKLTIEIRDYLQPDKKQNNNPPRQGNGRGPKRQGPPDNKR